MGKGYFCTFRLALYGNKNRFIKNFRILFKEKYFFFYFLKDFYTAVVYFFDTRYIKKNRNFSVNWRKLIVTKRFPVTSFIHTKFVRLR